MWMSWWRKIALSGSQSLFTNDDFDEGSFTGRPKQQEMGTKSRLLG